MIISLTIDHLDNVNHRVSICGGPASLIALANCLGGHDSILSLPLCLPWLFSWLQQNFCIYHCKHQHIMTALTELLEGDYFRLGDAVLLDIFALMRFWLDKEHMFA